MKGRVLVVAGSDSGGGAGIQADIKTITALGGFAMTAITALTAQNSRTVAGIHKPPPEFVAEQIRVTLEDLGCDAVKTGMMADAPIIEAAADALSERERECLFWVSEGKTTGEVAVILGVTSNTVNSYLANAIQKFGASNRAMAIATAIRLTLTDSMTISARPLSKFAIRDIAAPNAAPKSDIPVCLA